MLTPAVVHRWRPAIPLGVPHATTKADVYNVYNIPKGATVYVNIEHVLTSPFSQSSFHLTPRNLTVFWLRTQIYSTTRRLSILLDS